jgi:indolepyruvate ferredoxin oxidoreductase beta subunit
VNAVLLGALAATRALPMAGSDFEAAIAEGGVAVERNLAGFRAGLARALAGATPSAAPRVPRPWTEVKRDRAASLGGRAASFLALAERIEAEFPGRLAPTLGEAAARLVDYQDARYADDFLERVRRLRAVNADDRLAETFARRLAVWMSYEDVIRVADLKTRRGRFGRIREETGAGDGTVLVVTDYFKPDLDELYGILPAGIAAPVARWAERRWPAGRPTLGQHVRTTSVLGFLRVWMLGRLRSMRRSSLRYQREWALLERWQRAVLEAAALDAGLAVEVARLADVVKGYGDVRRRLSAAFTEFVDQFLPGIVAAGHADGYARAARLVNDARQRLLADEKSDATMMPPAVERVPVAAAPPGVLP